MKKWQAFQIGDQEVEITPHESAPVKGKQSD